MRCLLIIVLLVLVVGMSLVVDELVFDFWLENGVSVEI